MNAPRPRNLAHSAPPIGRPLLGTPGKIPVREWEAPEHQASDSDLGEYRDRIPGDRYVDRVLLDADALVADCLGGRQSRAGPSERVEHGTFAQREDRSHDEPAWV
jgi:hypothetical protein